MTRWHGMGHRDWDTGNWDAGSDLVVAATVGTAHRSVDLAALTQRLRPEPIEADPAAALLDAAALSAVARRTVLPTVPDATSPPAQPVSERLPVVPNVVRQVLSRVSNHEAILIEALTLIRRAGLRLPPELVPGLLDDPRVEVRGGHPAGGRGDRPLADDEESAMDSSHGSGPDRPHDVGRGDHRAAAGMAAGTPQRRPERGAEPAGGQLLPRERQQSGGVHHRAGRTVVRRRSGLPAGCRPGPQPGGRSGGDRLAHPAPGLRRCAATCEHWRPVTSPSAADCCAPLSPSPTSAPTNSRHGRSRTATRGRLC